MYFPWRRTSYKMNSFENEPVKEYIDDRDKHPINNMIPRGDENPMLPLSFSMSDDPLNSIITPAYRNNIDLNKL